MLGLVPAELWDYGLKDIGQGIATALGRNEPTTTLSIPGLGNCIPARSARAALITAIKALELPPDARIGVPLYCCAVVFKAIKTAGCRPRFIDVEPDTFCMSPADLRAKSSEVDAAVVVHMFGNVCDIPRLQEAAPGIPIIEDCALSLGSKLNGHQTGSLGDIAAFSFRSGKYLSVGEGGALFSSHVRINSLATQLISTLPSPNRTDECSHVVKTYLRSMLRSKPFYGLVGYALWERYNKRVQYSAKSPIVLSQIYRSDLARAIKRLPHIDSMIESQRANADYYSRTLDLDPTMLCHERFGAFYNRYQYPITFPSEDQRDLMAVYLHERGIETSKPVNDVVDVTTAHYNYAGDCPTAERLSKTVLVIPSYHTLKKAEIQRIVDCVNQGWKQVSADARIDVLMNRDSAGEAPVAAGFAQHSPKSARTSA